MIIKHCLLQVVDVYYRIYNLLVVHIFAFNLLIMYVHCLAMKLQSLVVVSCHGLLVK